MKIFSSSFWDWKQLFLSVGMIKMRGDFAASITWIKNWRREVKLYLIAFQWKALSLRGPHDRSFHELKPNHSAISLIGVGTSVFHRITYCNVTERERRNENYGKQEEVMAQQEVVLQVARLFCVCATVTVACLIKTKKGSQHAHAKSCRWW